MSSFSESALEKKLSELSNSQQSVQTLSLWLIHHRKHAGPIVSVWHRELRKGGRGAGPGRAGPPGVSGGEPGQARPVGGRGNREAGLGAGVVPRRAQREGCVVLGGLG